MRTIRRVAVLGAGTMGSRIAAHFANAGVPALLLDIVVPGQANRNAAAIKGIENAACEEFSRRTEIIPAEIQPPARSVAGASGIRIRMGSGKVTNGGDETDLVVAFNEQVLLGRVHAGELKAGCTILLESMWRESQDASIVKSYVETYESLVAAGYRVYEIPMERECRRVVADARRGKNMFALGMLCSIYSFDLQLAREQIALTFGKKHADVVQTNISLLEA